jgi:hypothetical protein
MPLKDIESAEITCLIDNSVDILLPMKTEVVQLLSTKTVVVDVLTANLRNNIV